MKHLVAIPLLERAAHAVAVWLSLNPELDVSQAEAHVLGYLHVRKTARIGEIHEEFGHHRSTLTSVLDRLERRHLLTRTIDPENRRTMIVALTVSGKKLAARVYSSLERFEAQALGRCSAEDQGAFLRVVDAICEAARRD